MNDRIAAGVLKQLETIGAEVNKLAARLAAPSVAPPVYIGFDAREPHALIKSGARLILRAQPVDTVRLDQLWIAPSIQRHFVILELRLKTSIALLNIPAERAPIGLDLVMMHGESIMLEVINVGPSPVPFLGCLLGTAPTPTFDPIALWQECI